MEFGEKLLVGIACSSQKPFLLKELSAACPLVTETVLLGSLLQILPYRPYIAHAVSRGDCVCRAILKSIAKN